jgi:N-methylhydantoinase B
MNVIELSLFANRISSICDEMGAVLRHAAFSPNIRERLDFSCAVFDAAGELCAQAAHIPVHLGSMAYAMRDVVNAFDWSQGDVVIFNDPYLGGTHLPDVTLVSPLIVDGILAGYVANRAHHADIGAESPGSMPISSTLHEEGQIIPPTRLVHEGHLQEQVMQDLVHATRNPVESRGDFTAQLSSARTGARRLQVLIEKMGFDEYLEGLTQLNDYGEQMARSALADIPDGRYEFADVMDDDGLGNEDISINVRLDVSGSSVVVDFTGTADQVSGNINCPLSVAAAGVFYVFRCLMPPQTPACAGSFLPIEIHARAGCLVNARYPAAVAAGNVETSTRIVDVLLGALAQAIPQHIPAASHGSMNNVAMGSNDAPSWDYYETIGGGMGASMRGNGLSGVQTHMTNTLNTPIESLELLYPLRVVRYALRRGSGGSGQHRGGDGLIREFEFLRSAQVTLLTERRKHSPWGLNGGAAGMSGCNRLNDQVLQGKIALAVKPGDRLTIESAGGGGYGH